MWHLHWISEDLWNYLQILMSRSHHTFCTKCVNISTTTWTTTQPYTRKQRGNSVTFSSRSTHRVTRLKKQWISFMIWISSKQNLQGRNQAQKLKDFTNLRNGRCQETAKWILICSRYLRTFRSIWRKWKLHRVKFSRRLWSRRSDWCKIWLISTLSNIWNRHVIKSRVCQIICSILKKK